MKRHAIRGIAAIAFLVLGCSDDSTRPRVTPAPRYPEATNKDIVISNFLKSYEDRNIDQFAKLLHQDYIWYNQPGFTPEFYERSQDVEKTGNMFLAARHTHPISSLWLDKLELRLYTGVWTPILEFNSEPCADCWETTRAYYLVLVMTNGGATYVANGSVRFVVVPVVTPEKTVYRIIRCDDMRPPL